MSKNITIAPSTRLLVIIVNYRTAKLVINCLKSLNSEVQSFSGTQVVVVDNNSQDDSVTAIQTAIQKQGWDNWASVVASEKNGGYAYGNNLVLRTALNSPEPPAYFLLLNPDTEVRPHALSGLCNFMELHSEVGIAGSSLETGDGEIWPFAFRFPSVLSELDSGLRLGLVTKLLSNWVVPRKMGNQATQVDWLPGASMLIRREVFQSVGLMDEQYFLYYEETDFCLQARKVGWTCWYVPQSRVKHISGQSTGVTGKDSHLKPLPKYWFDSRRRYFIKNYGILYAALTDAIWILSFALWRIRRVIQGKPDTDPPNYLQDFILNSVFFNFR